jgi:hypothetical protein
MIQKGTFLNSLLERFIALIRVDRWQSPAKPLRRRPVATTLVANRLGQGRLGVRRASISTDRSARGRLRTPQAVPDSMDGFHQRGTVPELLA